MTSPESGPEPDWLVGAGVPSVQLSIGVTTLFVPSAGTVALPSGVTPVSGVKTATLPEGSGVNGAAVGAPTFDITQLESSSTGTSNTSRKNRLIANYLITSNVYLPGARSITSRPPSSVKSVTGLTVPLMVTVRAAASNTGRYRVA